jgi:hypothetical protein
MRRALLALSAAGMLAATGCGGGSGPSAAAAGTNTSSESSSSSATASLPAATTSVAPPVPIAPPTVFSGVGSATVPITKPAGTTTVVATITGNQYSHHLGVRGLDGSQDNLVQTDAPYSGSTVLDGDGGSTTRLFVHAYGPWSITLSDPRSAPVFGHAYSGSGDTVLVYQGKGGTATVTGGAAGADLQIRAYSGGRGASYILNAPAPYNGQLHWAGGTVLIAVRTTGPWTISIN